MDLCFELATQLMARIGKAISPVDEVHGFRYFDDRDLMGSSTGRRIQGAARDNAVLVGDEDADFVGGSYVIIQKYLHDLAAWNALSTEAQERIIGRSQAFRHRTRRHRQATSAHSALLPRRDGKEIKILRDNYALRRPGHGEFGTISSATAVRPARSTDASITCSSAPARTMIGCSNFSRAVTEICSSCPRRHFWENVSEVPTIDDQPAVANPQQHRRPNFFIHPIDERRFARHRFSQGDIST